MGPEVGGRGGGGGGTKEGAVEQKQQMQRLVSPTHTGGVYLQHSTNMHSLC